MTAAANDRPALAYTLLVLTTLCWAGNAVASRFAVGEVSPMVLVVLRWVGCVILLTAVGWRHIGTAWPVLRGRLRYIALMGMTGFTLFNAFFYVAAHYTTAVNIGILQGAMPVLLIVGGYLVMGSRVTALQIVGVAVTLAGVATVVFAGDPGQLVALALNLGDGLMLTACLFYAGFTIALRDKPDVPPVLFLAALAMAALLSALPLALIEAQLGYSQWPTATGWLVVAYVTLFPSLLAQLFWMQGVGMIGPARAGVFINLVPIFAALLAVALLAEPVRAFHMVALGLVLGGIWLAERHRAA